jgi:hypothetical protein
MHHGSLMSDSATELRFQTALARVLTDQSLRLSVFSKSQHDLCEVDTKRLLAMDPERLDIYAELVFLNRLAKTAEGLPITTKLLGARTWEHMREFARQFPSVGIKKHAEAMAFGSWLKSEFAKNPPAHPYFLDVLKYETTALDLRFSFDGIYTLGNTEDQADTDRLLHSPKSNFNYIPLRLRHHCLLSFAHDPAPIIDTVNEGKRPHDAVPKKTLMLLYVAPSGTLMQISPSPTAAAFLSAIDGFSSLEVVIQTAARILRSSDAIEPFKMRCLDLCEKLIDMRIVALKPCRLSCS